MTWRNLNFVDLCRIYYLPGTRDAAMTNTNIAMNFLFKK